MEGKSAQFTKKSPRCTTVRGADHWPARYTANRSAISLVFVTGSNHESNKPSRMANTKGSAEPSAEGAPMSDTTDGAAKRGTQTTTRAIKKRCRTETIAGILI